jgi:hypothetical protein
MNNILWLSLAVADLICAPLMAQSTHPEITGTFSFSRVVEVAKHSGGTAALEAHQVEIYKDSIHTAVMFLLYEAESGNYWWAVQGISPDGPSDLLDTFLTKHRIYVSDGHLWVFGFVSPMFGARKESGQAIGIADAEKKALGELRRRFSDIESHSWNGIHHTNLWSFLGNKFLNLTNSAMPEPPTKLSSITRDEGNWVVGLDGPNGDSARITLNDHFEVIRSEIIPQ